MSILEEIGFFGPGRTQAYANVELLQQALATLPNPTDDSPSPSSALLPAQSDEAESKTCPICNDLKYGSRWYDDSTVRGPVHYLNTTFIAVDQSAQSCCWCNVLETAIVWTLQIEPRHITSAPIYIRLETEAFFPAPLKVIVVTSEEQTTSSMNRMEMEIYRSPEAGMSAVFGSN